MKFLATAASIAALSLTATASFAACVPFMFTNIDAVDAFQTSETGQAMKDSMQFFEVQDGTTETNHGIIDYLVVTSTDFLDSLDAPVRDQFLTILEEVTLTRNAEAFAVNEEAKQAIIDAGGEVRQLSAEQRDAWVAAMKPVWAEFVGDVGQENIDAAQAINAGL